MGSISPDEYINLECFAFEIFDHLFFTDHATAVRLGGGDNVVIKDPGQHLIYDNSEECSHHPL